MLFSSVEKPPRLSEFEMDVPEEITVPSNGVTFSEEMAPFGSTWRPFSLVL